MVGEQIQSFWSWVGINFSKPILRARLAALSQPLTSFFLILSESAAAAAAVRVCSCSWAACSCSSWSFISFSMTRRAASASCSSSRTCTSAARPDGEVLVRGTTDGRYVAETAEIFYSIVLWAKDAGAGGGGGQWRQLAPTTLKLCWRRPPTLDCQCCSFLFLFVFARELPPKNSGPNPESF